MVVYAQLSVLSVRRIVIGVCALLLLGLPAAEAKAGEASGELVYCTGGDYCRYFPNPRLDVTFRAAPGERNDLRLLSVSEGVRILDSGAAIVPGPTCTAVDPNEVRCGPPAPEGLVASAYTGDGDDRAFAERGSVYLGRGSDHGSGSAFLDGGPGNDRLLGAGFAGFLEGGTGEDHLSGTSADDTLTGGSGQDRLIARGGIDRIDGGSGADFISAGGGRDTIAAGPGNDLVRASDPARDVVRCGRGDDRAVVSADDRVFGCERVISRERG